MSLINDALKKAQRDRTGGPAPEVPVPGGGPRPTESYRTPRATSTYLLLGGGALIGLVVAVVAVVLLRPAAPEKTAAPVAARSEPPAAQPAPETATAPKVESTPPPAASVVAAAPTTPPVIAASSEPATTKRNVEPLALNITVPAASATSTSSATTPPAATTEPARAAPAVAPATASVATAPVTPPAPPPDPRVLQKQLADLVEGFRVTGIRAAGNDSKVLMNDRVFRVGDVVDRKHGVTLTGVTANSLTFGDGNGHSYTRSF